MDTSFLMILALALQLTGAIVAFRLAFLNDWKLAWLAFGLGLCFAAALSVLSFHQFVVLGDMPNQHLFGVLLLLLFSLLMLSGLANASSFFESRKPLEAALNEAERRWRNLSETSLEGIWVINENAVTTFVNGRMAQMLGYAAEEMLGRPIFDYLDEEGRWATRQALQAREQGIAGQRDSCFYKKDGTQLWTMISSTPIRDDKGGYQGVLSMVTDISQRKRAEVALKEGEEKYRALFEASTDAIFLEDLSGNILDCNTAACWMYGYSLEELLSLSASDLVPRNVEQGFPDILAREELSGEVFVEAEGRRKDGSIFSTEVCIRSVDLHGKRFVIVHVRDITARKMMEEEKRRFETRLRQQQKLESIGTLASGIAHEINNPINGILNYAQLISDSVQEGSSESRFSREILTECERISTIVKNLLAFAHPDRESRKPHRIKDIVDSTITLIRTLLRKDQILLEVDIPEELPPVNCRSQQIQQILMNLVTNARDALNMRYAQSDEKKRIRISSRILTRDENAWLRTTVEDWGVGIKPEIAERIFDPFFTTKARSVGTGLGLSLSHGIARENGGLLHFESVPGEYTRFHLDLPLDA